MKLDAYKLKWIAIIGMVLNHIVIAWWDIIPLGLAYPFYLVGGLTFPIMGFFVVEGYKHTRNLKRYVSRILIIGAISLPFHIIAIGMPFRGDFTPVMLFSGLNIMFTIALSIGVLVLYDKIKSRAAFWLLFILIIIPLSMFFVEWAPHGVVMVLLFYIIKNEKARRILPPILAVVISFAVSLVITTIKIASLYVQGLSIDDLVLVGLNAYPEFATVSLVFLVGMVAASFMLLTYNNERGKSMKWLFYTFYPAHLAILAIGKLIFGF